jgi:hypothetical protein
MAWLCLAVLLMASIVQVTHLCGSRMLDASHTPQFHAVSSSGTVCLVCLVCCIFFQSSSPVARKLSKSDTQLLTRVFPVLRSPSSRLLVILNQFLPFFGI